MKGIYFIVVVLYAGLMLQSCNRGGNGDCEFDISPKPTVCEQFQGEFTINTNTQIVVKEFTPSNMFYAELLHNAIQEKMKHIIGVVEEYQGRSKNCIIIEESKDRNVGKSGFEIYISPNMIRLKAKDCSGYLYAVRTLIQLMNELDAEGSFPCIYLMDVGSGSVKESVINLAGNVSVDSIFRYMDIMVKHRQGRLFIKNADSAQFDTIRLQEVRDRGQKYCIEVVNY